MGTRRRTSNGLDLQAMDFTILLSFLTIIISQSLAQPQFTDSSKRPILNQKIGFAGELREEDERNATDNSKDRSPLFQSSSSSIDEQFYSARPRYDSQQFHPNHRYPNQPVIYKPGDKDRYLLTLNKQPTSSIVSSTFTPRRLEVDSSHSHHDEYIQDFQYGGRPKPPSPSPTPVYKRAIYRDNPSPTPYTAYYTKSPPGYDDESTPHPEPKKYAFAYAVRDDHNGDDYSHKESRDGKVTMGEYKVLLPDGRLQVVRYTADAKAGFKADVTYEGDQQYNGPHLAKIKEPYKPSPGPAYYGHVRPAPELRKAYIETSPSPTPIFNSSPNPNYRGGPPVKTYAYPHPSISPAVVYKGTQVSSASSNIDYEGRNKPRLNAITPTPYGFVKHTPDSPPRNIYEKINSAPAPTPSSKNQYAPIPRGFRAGPTTKSFGHGARRHRKIIEVPPTPNYLPGYLDHGSSTESGGKSRLIPIEHFKAGPYTNSPKEYKLLATPAPKIYQNQTPAPSVYHPIPVGPSYSPKEYAGDQPTPKVYPGSKIISSLPKQSQYRLVGSPTPTPTSTPAPPIPYDFHHYANTPSPKIYHHHDIHRGDHHFVVVDDHSHHPSPSPGPIENQHQQHHDVPVPPAVHHFHHQPHPTPPVHDEYHQHPLPPHEEPKSVIPPVKSSLATFTSILGVTPKPVLYIKSKPPVGVGRPVQPSVGGIVYLETPARGIRPTEFGVQEILDRIPHDNLPRPKTTTHPYELGSKDYGDSVGYGTTGAGEEKHKGSFIPSQQIPNEYLVSAINTDYFDNHHHHPQSLHSRELVSYENH